MKQIYISYVKNYIFLNCNQMSPVSFFLLLKTPFENDYLINVCTEYRLSSIQVVIDIMYLIIFNVKFYWLIIHL